MKKIALMLLVGILLANTTVYSKTINEADTEICDTVKMALISSNREPVDKAITEVYKNDKNAPEEGLSWASWETEILKIKQVYGIGGLYEITLKVYPYYGAHNGYGEYEAVINTSGELIGYKHLKTYP
ncbi:DUF3888 domain-containing protein [Bacillus sp. EB600]|uniref:DUF3888 domain-containing protein n=1 Tax=Bacillus sp. EB600 TaxID=2806345 RepID=UPI00210BD678|nr:DUF3888 domain-containing protein [Bacillus sp. EB600]MCQ6282928.1 DUF3888 domain-containing protein [Bacillus sp. EB600]